MQLTRGSENARQQPHDENCDHITANTSSDVKGCIYSHSDQKHYSLRIKVELHAQNRAARVHLPDQTSMRMNALVDAKVKN